MLNLFTTDHWRQARANNLKSARKCRDTLTNPAGHWGYAPEDERVKVAVAKWVERARNAHRIALGHRPVIAKAIVINQGGAVQGSLYAA